MRASSVRVADPGATGRDLLVGKLPVASAGSAAELEVAIVDGVVEVRGGRVRGVERGGVWSFSGVPYAASPAGEGRWRPPAPPVPVGRGPRLRPVRSDRPAGPGRHGAMLGGGARPP